MNSKPIQITILMMLFDITAKYIRMILDSKVWWRKGVKIKKNRKNWKKKKLTSYFFMNQY